MRVMVIVKATASSEAGAMPPAELLEAMGAYNEALMGAGVLRGGEGILPSSVGRRVTITADERTVTDGPFTPVTELAAGFWIWDVPSMDVAIDWAMKCPAPMPGETSVLELRRLFEVEDFGDAMPDELQDRERAMRAELEGAQNGAQSGAPAEAPAAHPVRTCLWFDGDAEDAAALYVSLLPNSRITTPAQRDPDRPALIVELELNGAPYQLLNGGPMYPQTPAASIAVRTADQAETDRLWDALTADGGRESRCGWLVDRFGVSWQIVPEALPRMLGAADRAAAERAQAAMLTMNRIDIAALEAAFAGDA